MCAYACVRAGVSTCGRAAGRGGLGDLFVEGNHRKLIITLTVWQA